jgi:hypothetical protein
VQPVGHKDQRAERSVGGDWSVAVVPVQDLLEHEEREDADGQPGVHPQSIADPVHGFGHHVEQRAAEQRTGGEGHDGEYQPLEGRFLQDQGEATDETDHAQEGPGDDDPGQRGQAVLLGQLGCVATGRRAGDSLTVGRGAG